MLLDEAKDRLDFHLAVQDAFWFALVVSNDARTRSALREHGAEAVAIEVRSIDEPLPTLLERVLDPEADRLLWVVADGDPDQWEPATGAVLLALNERREALRTRPHGVIFEGRERLKSVLRNLAPDLFSIRACLFETGSWSWPADRPPGSDDAISELDRAIHDRVAQSLVAARRLKGRLEIGARRSRVGALTRAADALIAQGWFTEAAPVVHELRTEAYQLASEQFAEKWALAATARAEGLSGVVSREAGDLEAAVASFASAAWMRRLLYDEKATDAVFTGRELARARSQLGQALLDQGERDRARETLESSIELGESILSERPDDLEVASQLALTLSVLGDLHLGVIDRPAAREVLERALVIREELAATGAARFRRYLGIAWGRMGALAESEGDLDEALQARQRALAIARELALEHPDNAAWDVQYADAEGRVGELLLARGDVQTAATMLEDSAARAERNAEEDPDNARWQGAVAMAQLRLSALAAAQGDPDAARHAADEAASVLADLVSRDPTNRDWLRALRAAELRLKIRGED